MKLTEKHLGRKVYFFRKKTSREIEYEKAEYEKHLNEGVVFQSSGCVTLDMMFNYSYGILKEVIRHKKYEGKKNGKKLFYIWYQYKVLDTRLNSTEYAECPRPTLKKDKKYKVCKNIKRL